MRVLHIDTGTSMRGGQWQALYLLEGLSQRGIECRLLAPPGSHLLTAASAAGYDALPLRRLSIAWQCSGFDLIHAHDARAHTFALLAGAPLVVSRRVAFPVARSLISNYKYARPAAFLAVSNFVRTILIGAGIPLEKISLVYDGVHLPECCDWKHRTQVVALDSDDPAKGKALVEQSCRLAGIPVHFSRDLNSDLPRAALFVYITELEGLGSAALLAMSYGVPVVASRTGGLPEIVEHGVTGLLTRNRPEAIAAAIKQLSDDHTLAVRLGQRGRAAVEHRFTVARMVEDTLAVYERTLARMAFC